MTLKGDKELIKNLKRLRQVSKSLQPFFKRVGVYMLASINQTFQEEGPGWKFLKPSTIFVRAKQGYWPGRILQVSGKLKGSITYEATDDNVRIGAADNVPYAIYNQSLSGDKMATKHNPSRPFIGWQDRDAPRITKLFEDHFNKEINNIFRRFA